LCCRLGKKLIEPLTNLIHSTSAMSLLYECINTVIAVLISISSGKPILPVYLVSIFLNVSPEKTISLLSVSDPDSGSCAFLIPRSGIRDG
jgi:hypothetical protein